MLLGLHTGRWFAAPQCGGNEKCPREVCRDAKNETRRFPMLWTIAVILLILWILGFVTSYTMGGFIHILLVVAVVVILVRLIQGRV